LIVNIFLKEVQSKQKDWRAIVSMAVTSGVPVPALASSLCYFDSYRRAQLPANLTQAQRDFFGAHTYVRTDTQETVHSEWAKL